MVALQTILLATFVAVSAHAMRRETVVIDCPHELAAASAFIDESAAEATAWGAWSTLSAVFDKFPGLNLAALNDPTAWDVDQATMYLAEFARLGSRVHVDRKNLATVLAVDLLAREGVFMPRYRAALATGTIEPSLFHEHVALWKRLDAFRRLELTGRLSTKLRAQHSAMLVRQTEALLVQRGTPFHEIRRLAPDNKTRNFFRIVPYSELKPAEKTVVDRVGTSIPLGLELSKLAETLKRRGVPLDIDPGVSELRAWTHRQGNGIVAVLLPDEILSTSLPAHVEAELLAQTRSVVSVDRSQSLFALSVHVPGHEAVVAAGFPMQFATVRDEILQSLADGREAIGRYIGRARDSLPSFREQEKDVFAAEQYAHDVLTKRMSQGAYRGQDNAVGYGGLLDGITPVRYFVITPSTGERRAIQIYRENHAYIEFPVTRATRAVVERLRARNGQVPPEDVMNDELIELVFEAKRMAEAAAYDIGELRRVVTAIAALENRHRAGEDVAPEFHRIAEGMVLRNEEHLTRRMTARRDLLWDGRAMTPAAAVPSIGPVTQHTVKIPAAVTLFADLQQTTVPVERRALIERIGMRAVISLLISNKLRWMDVSYDNLGFDLSARDPRTGRVFEIEVKTTAEVADRNRLSFSLDELVSLMTAGQRAVVARPVVHPDGVVEVLFLGHGIDWSVKRPR